MQVQLPADLDVTASCHYKSRIPGPWLSDDEAGRSRYPPKKARDGEWPGNQCFHGALQNNLRVQNHGAATSGHCHLEVVHVGKNVGW